MELLTRPMPSDQTLTSDQHRPRYSIIIPAYNESARVGATLERVLAYVAERGWDAEVIAVDDGSRDNTTEIIRSFAQKNPRLRLLQNPGNRGKGYSVRNGMLHAQGEILLFSDADLSSPIEEAEKLLAALADGADVAIGSRWLRRDLQTERQPLYRQLFGRVFNLMLRVTLGLKFKDTQCGFKAFTRRAAGIIFPLQQIERWGFDPELLYLAERVRAQGSRGSGGVGPLRRHPHQPAPRWKPHVRRDAQDSLERTLRKICRLRGSPLHRYPGRFHLDAYQIPDDLRPRVPHLTNSSSLESALHFDGLPFTRQRLKAHGSTGLTRTSVVGLVVFGL